MRALIVLYKGKKSTWFLCCEDFTDSSQGAVSLEILLFFSLPFFRQLAYESFLRMQHRVAGLCIYAIYSYLLSEALPPRLYVCIIVGIFLLTFIVQFLFFLYWNGALAFADALER